MFSSDYVDVFDTKTQATTKKILSAIDSEHLCMSNIVQSVHLAMRIAQKDLSNGGTRRIVVLNAIDEAITNAPYKEREHLQYASMTFIPSLIDSTVTMAHTLKSKTSTCC